MASFRVKLTKSPLVARQAATRRGAARAPTTAASLSLDDAVCATKSRKRYADGKATRRLAPAEHDRIAEPADHRRQRQGGSDGERGHGDGERAQAAGAGADADVL
jgi:hypothetical protein